MDELSSYYQELSLLQLKYEHLTQTGRSLLKPWPVNSTHKEQDESASNGHQQQEETISMSEPHAKELEQLDMLLSRAQKMRISSKPEEKLSKRSIKLASSIYKPSDHGDQRSKPTSKPRQKLKSKDHAGPKCRPSSKLGPGQSKSVASLLECGIEDKQVTTKALAGAKEILKQSTVGNGGIHTGRAEEDRLDSSSLMENNLEPQGFSLTKDGTKLSMPSKYNRLQKLMSRCSEVLAQDEETLIASKAAATHFTKRLLARKRKGSVDRTRLQLCVEELQHLKEKLASISPQEWTVSERSQWEDILLLKTKLEMLTHCYQVAFSLGKRETSNTPRHGETTIGREGASCSALSMKEFGYTTLSDWNTLTLATLRERYLQWERKYFQQLQETILPVVYHTLHANGCRHAEGSRHGSRHADDSRHADSSRDGHDDVCAAIAVLREVHLASKLPTNAVYLDTEKTTHQTK